MSIETTLGAFDFTVIAVYFAITLASGLFMGRFVKSSKDFFSGGKKVPLAGWGRWRSRCWTISTPSTVIAVRFCSSSPTT